MNFIRQIERLQLLNKLLEQERTGTPEELAQRLGIKRRTLYDMIESIKSLGADVVYDRKLQTFYYRNHQKIKVNFSMEILKRDEVEKIVGGYEKFSFRAFFPHRAQIHLPHH